MLIEQGKFEKLINPKLNFYQANKRNCRTSEKYPYKTRK